MVRVEILEQRSSTQGDEDGEQADEEGVDGR